jgi:hypothetical protein
MATVVKLSDRRQARYFREHELMQILLLGRMHGWDMPGISPWELTSDEANATRLCTALEKGYSEIESRLLPLGSSDKPICADCLMQELIKRNLLKLIQEFLEFCEGQPFLANVQN